MASNIIRAKIFVAAVLVAGIAHSANAAPCRLSLVLDRTGSMGSGNVASSKCSIARNYAIGIIQGFINGDDVSIAPRSPMDPWNPAIDPGFYSSQCNLAERRVQIIGISEVDSAPGDDEFSQDNPDDFTGGFVSPNAALAQLNALEASDLAGTTDCRGFTQLADAICVAAANLRTAAPNSDDTRRMKIITDGGESGFGESAEDVPTNCDAGVPISNPMYESLWIANATNELLLGGSDIQIDAILFSDLFFVREELERAGDYVTAKVVPTLSSAETNFFTTIAATTGGLASLINELGDIAGRFTSSTGGIEPTISAIPMPVAFWILIAVLVGLVGIRCARRPQQ